MPTFPYYPITPVASQPPKNSPPNFNTNFGSIAGLIGTDHYQFSDGSNGGWHKQSTYVVQGSVPASASGQVVHFAQTTGGISEEWMKRDTATPIQLTSGLANQGATSSFGQSFIPGGFQIKWGSEKINNNTQIKYADPSRNLTNFPNKTIAVFVTPQGPDFSQTSTDGNFDPASFYVYASKNNLFVSWLAIGY